MLQLWYFVAGAFFAVPRIFAGCSRIKGKKKSIGYAPTVSFAMSQINSSGYFMKGFQAFSISETYIDEQYGKRIAMNATHTVDFNYVYKRSRSLIFSTSFMRSGCYFEPQYGLPLIGKMTGFGMEFGQKRYAYDLAPLGYYFARKLGAYIYIADIPSTTLIGFDSVVVS